MAPSGARSATRLGVQGLVAALGLIGVFSAASGALLGPRDATEPVTFALDSNFRFLSVLILAAGAVLLWCVPRVERATVPLRVISVAIFVGGCARLLSLTATGPPDAFYVGIIVAELLGPALIVVLQARITEPP